jgi:hypothetical protein
MKIGKNIEILHAWLILVPAAMFALGITMNCAVMAANHSLMPVLAPAEVCDAILHLDGAHICMTQSTHLKFLADWISLGNTSIDSPGDLLERGASAIWQFCLGAWALLQCYKRGE